MRLIQSTARSRLALIYQRTGRLNEAIEQLEDALEHDPNNAEEYTAKLNELIGSSGGGAPSTQHAPSNPFAAMMGGMGGMDGGGGGGMPDFGSLLSNPEFMRTAMDLMQRPEMQIHGAEHDGWLHGRWCRWWRGGER